jgi:hypothetical protein
VVAFYGAEHGDERVKQTERKAAAEIEAATLWAEHDRWMATPPGERSRIPPHDPRAQGIPRPATTQGLCGDPFCPLPFAHAPHTPTGQIAALEAELKTYREAKRYLVPFCPDCGAAGLHTLNCDSFANEPVTHGNFEYVVKVAE